MPYRHTQTGWVAVVICLAVMAAFYLIPTPWEARQIAQPIICFILLILAALMAALTVEVDDASVRVKFGVGLIHKSFRLDEIASCQPVRNKWWWGWGIRRIHDGWLYNVSGLNAVELVMGNGKKFRIGTDQPRRLADSIQARLRKNS
jgi:hypothetical protein